MTTFKHPRGLTYQYDFRWRGERYTGSTGQVTKDDADLVEAEIKKRIRQEAFGIAPFDRLQTPSFTTWAEEHLSYVEKRGRLARPDELEKTIRLCLQFWGRRPARPRTADGVKRQFRRRVEAAVAREQAAPYHDLRLADPILDPEWIERFEDWMTSLGLSGPRKNHYRSAMSGLYRTALLPAYRKRTRVSANPFRDLQRDPVPQRQAVLTTDQIRAWMAAAAPHARLAMAIAAYAPELREGSILQLEWAVHFDADLTRITVHRHKTAGHTHRPQIVPVPSGLQRILTWAREQQRQQARGKQKQPTHVVWYKGGPVKSLKTGLRAAVARANAMLPPDAQMVYGVARGGATFHTIRHSIATLLAEMGVPEKIRQLVMGHRSLQTTQGYTHLAGTAKIEPLETLSDTLQLAAAVQGTVQAGHPQTRKNPQQIPPALTKGRSDVRRAK